MAEINQANISLAAIIEDIRKNAPQNIERFIAFIREELGESAPIIITQYGLEDGKQKKLTAVARSLGMEFDKVSQIALNARLLLLKQPRRDKIFAMSLSYRDLIKNPEQTTLDMLPHSPVLVSISQN